MSKSVRKAARRIHSAPVVLDTVGMVRRKNGVATLRLKIVGPVEKLREFKINEGDRMRVFAHTVAAA